LIYLLEHLGVTETVIDENRARIEKLCDCVLEVADPAHREGKRGYVTFDDGESIEGQDADDKNPEESKATAVAVCTAYRAALTNNDRASFASALADMLLSVRNARVHATYLKPSHPKRIGPRDPVSKRTRKGKMIDGVFVSEPDPSEYELNEAAQIQLSIGKLLLGAKTKRPSEDVENIVRSRVNEIRDEIYERVAKWRPSK
jgi:hypothetical protein